MAIYHFTVDIIKRSSGHSSVAAAAYRAGENLKDEVAGKEHDYSRKTGVVHQEIMLPENAPETYKDRQTLWNSVEKAEKANNAQLARSIEFALPKELTRDQQIELARNYIKENYVDKGMCADWVIHDKGDGNPHVHVLLTMRGIDKNGKWNAKEKKEYALDENGQKIPILDKYGNQKVDNRNRKLWKRITVQKNEWNDQDLVPQWRKSWQDAANKAMEKAGLDERIDCRSYEEQGSEKLPQIHMGKEATALEHKGIETDRGNYNREVIEYNAEIEDLEKAEQELADDKLKLKKEMHKILQNDYAASQRLLHDIELYKNQITNILSDIFKRQREMIERIMNTILNSRLFSEDYEKRTRDKFEVDFKKIDRYLASGDSDIADEKDKFKESMPFIPEQPQLTTGSPPQVVPGMAHPTLDSVIKAGVKAVEEQAKTLEYVTKKANQNSNNNDRGR